MKKYKNAVAMLALSGVLVVQAGMAYAEEAKDWSVTVGLKDWLSTFQARNATCGSFCDASYRPTKDNELMGTVAVNYKDFIFSFGLMRQPKPNNQDAINDITTGISYQLRSKETDISIGYLVPRFSMGQLLLSIGIKNMDYEFRPVIPGSGIGNLSYKWNHPVVGLTYYDYFEGTKVYGFGAINLGSGSTTVNYAPAATGGKYSSVELGLIYPLTNQFRVTGSYKVQRLGDILGTTNNAPVGDTQFRAKGVVLGGSYTF